MNRVLKRPMFRIGGSAGTGITTGLDRTGYAGNEPTFKEYLEGMNEEQKQMQRDDLFQKYQEYLKRRQVAEQKTMAADGGRIGYQTGTNPYVMGNFMPGTGPGFLTGFGLNLLSTSPTGNIFQTAATAAKEPFEILQRGQFAKAEKAGERDFITSEREKGEDFRRELQKEEIQARKDIAAMKSDDKITVAELASTYLSDYDGDLNKATNKAEFFLNIRPELETSVGATQIGGLIEVDLSDAKAAKRFASQNRNKVGKVFFDINTGQLKKLVKDPESKALGFIDFSVTPGQVPDIEGETLPEPEKDKKTRSFDFLSERQKQILKEGYSPEKDTGFGLDFYE